MLTRRALLAAGSICSLFAATGRALADGTVRIAALKAGTVTWEIDTILRNGFDKKHGITVLLMPVVGKLSADVMLAGGETDMIVTDWIWVSHQRRSGADYTFLPYSRQVGAILVMPGSNLNSLVDLKGKKIGIAGGPTDKSWILLRGLAKMRDHFDLAQDAEPVFAAPPLLNEQLESGAIDALITFWQYAALLKAKGAREIMSVDDAARAMGLDADTPLVGYVYSEKWSHEHDNAAIKFAAASADAKALLATDDREWDRVRPLMNVKTDAEFEALKAGFRAGIPKPGPIDIQSAILLLSILAKFGGDELVGEQPVLAPGTFATN